METGLTAAVLPVDARRAVIGGGLMTDAHVSQNACSAHPMPRIPLARVECRVLGPVSRHARTWLGSAVRGLIGDQLQRLAATSEAHARAFVHWFGAITSPGAFESGHESRPYALGIRQNPVPGDRSGELIIRLTHVGPDSSSLACAAEAFATGLREGKLKDMVALKVELRAEAPGGSGNFVDWDGQRTPVVGFLNIPARPFSSLRLRLLSPLKLLHRGQLLVEPQPRDLVAAALRRISDLATRYGEPSSLPTRALLERAAALQWKNAQFEHVRAIRLSTTQQQVYPVDGVIGQAELDLSEHMELWPVIASIPYLQVGKATTMGFGCVRLEAPRAAESDPSKSKETASCP